VNTGSIIEHEAFVGLGSNLDDPAAQIRHAVEHLDDLAETHVVAVSSLYRSAPFGPIDQPDFINAVAHLQTRLDATKLLRELLELELRQGRVRAERWGPRTIDLDLLVFGGESCDTEMLNLPHPGIAARNFVLLPLQEIAPDLVVPGLGRVADIAVDMNEPRISRID
jgi:2-amino-4-hydroxy-6-hydroxymethyldihydropteridine diphosphokinase